MKKAEFYIRLKSKNFKKVNGYITTVKDNNGNTILVGFHKGVFSNKVIEWYATHIDSGMRLAIGNTRKDCYQKATNQKTLNSLPNALKKPLVKKLIKEMKEFYQTL